IPRGSGQRWRLALNYFSFAIFASLLAPVRCRGVFDLIFVFEPSPITVGIPAIMLKKFKRAPVMFWVQDLWPESLSATRAIRSELLLHWVAQLVRFIYQRCDRILVQSEGFIPSVTALGADPQRVAYFPNWAETLYRPVDMAGEAPERMEVPANIDGVKGGLAVMLNDSERLEVMGRNLYKFGRVS